MRFFGKIRQKAHAQTAADVEAVRRDPGAHTLFGWRSYSHTGEDGTLRWMFEKKPGGFYVDVGCCHPFHYSNTAMLHHEFGWSGINVDIDHRGIGAFNGVRPLDINLVAAVSPLEGTVMATVFDGAFTLSHLGAVLEHERHMPHRSIEIDALPLATLLDRYVPEGRGIDFLNVDAEGHDFEILQSNDWNRFRPTVIATETRRDDLAMVLRHPSYAYLRDRGYALISHTVCTSIFWLEDNKLGV